MDTKRIGEQIIEDILGSSVSSRPPIQALSASNSITFRHKGRPVRSLVNEALGTTSTRTASVIPGNPNTVLNDVLGTGSQPSFVNQIDGNVGGGSEGF